MLWEWQNINCDKSENRRIRIRSMIKLSAGREGKIKDNYSFSLEDFRGLNSPVNLSGVVGLPESWATFLSKKDLSTWILEMGANPFFLPLLELWLILSRSVELREPVSTVSGIVPSDGRKRRIPACGLTLPDRWAESCRMGLGSAPVRLPDLSVLILDFTALRSRVILVVKLFIKSCRESTGGGLTGISSAVWLNKGAVLVFLASVLLEKKQTSIQIQHKKKSISNPWKSIVLRSKI